MSTSAATAKRRAMVAYATVNRGRMAFIATNHRIERHHERPGRSRP
jgi:hypothetical protein